MLVLGVLACAGVQVKCLVARGASRTIYFIEIYERNDVEAHDDHALEHVCAPGVLRLVGSDERVLEGLSVDQGARVGSVS